MITGKRALSFSVVALCVVALSVLPARAGSMPIGIVARSLGAAISGQPATSDTALFSRDNIQVPARGMAIIKLTGGEVVVLDRQTEASFLRQPERLTVSLNRGSLSLLEPAVVHPVNVNAAGFSVQPVQGYKTMAKVAILGNRLTVTASEGRVRLEGRGTKRELVAGRTITLGAAPAAAPQGTAISAGLLGSHAARIAAATTAGGAGTAAGIAVAASHGGAGAAGLAAAASAAHTPPSISGAGSSNSANSDDASESAGDENGDDNSNAINNVAANAPPQACEHAASPSVPAAACSGDSDDH